MAIPDNFRKETHQIRDELRLFSITIVTISEDGTPKAIGSGTLVDLEGQRGILTAAHVVRDVPPHRICLIFGDRQDGFNKHILKGLGQGGKTHSGIPDAIDVAFLQLSLKGVDAISKFKRFLPDSRIEAGVGFRERQFVAYGTPKALVDPVAFKEKKLLAKPLFYVTQATPVRPIGKSLEDHILLEFPALDNVYVDNGLRLNGASKEEAALLENPAGISGGGIWTTRTSNGDYADPNTFVLVGILTGFIPEGRYLVGNQIQHGLAIARKCLSLTT
jgi:hypothetical protein